MNTYMRKTEPASAEELARQLKEARKEYRSANSGSAGWRLVESNHLEYARHVIAAFFVAHRVVSTEVVSDLPTQELQRKVESQASTLPIFFDTGANCTVAPAATVRDLGLQIEEGSAASVAGIGGVHRLAGHLGPNQSGPRPDTAAAHVCSSLGKSAGPSCGAAPSQ